ncbi:transglutaminase-like cysteine peptidase [Chelatococcus sp. SYSU_G07232]|uniref:Transglutaminase-like cysteine peptidase n=1 Tax=Chelatococcus albus TaxID=3047466 RepID=A0ABT7AEJ8_9HYPH|nr:transglutaminase-like cysteine peptidase [Chelatococcus sp. SYSU_G07232]MDJ1157046.1 transglutaminase-like cysteine peptidase [Chelatococcus sp. SYSU_G07232]
MKPAHLAALLLAAAPTVLGSSGSVRAMETSPPFLNAIRPASAPVGFGPACAAYRWLCSNAQAVVRSLAPLNDAQLLAAAKAVNVEVNAAIRQVNDIDNVGVGEQWSLPENGTGDCEDIAMLKMKLLQERGIPARLLSLAVVVKDTNESHVVLVLRTQAGDHVLDNLTNRIAPWADTGYTFIKMQNAANKRQWDLIVLGPRAQR